jgi:hypothetical protein
MLAVRKTTDDTLLSQHRTKLKRSADWRRDPVGNSNAAKTGGETGKASKLCST